MSSAGKLVAGGSALAASVTLGTYSLEIAASATALPFVLGTVAIVGTSYAVGEYFKSRK